MITSTIVLLHMTVGLTGLGQPCGKDVQCTSGQCRNYSGSSNTCCEPSGTACTGSSDQYCCNNGNSSVACNQDPNNNRQYICGSPTGGYCADDKDCAQYLNGAYSGGGAPWYDIRCQAILALVDAGPGWNAYEVDAGVDFSFFTWVPFDGGPNIAASQYPNECTLCTNSASYTYTRNYNWGAYGVNDLSQACAMCCSGNCFGYVDGGGVIDSGAPSYSVLGNIQCCSENHQTCTADGDCCNQGTTSYKCDLNTACNKDAGQCNDGGSIGVCCLVDGHTCDAGSDCCSGTCASGSCAGTC